jgi:hypothetical protein
MLYDDDDGVDADPNYPKLTFELQAQRSVAQGGKVYRLVASGQIGTKSGPYIWTENAALHVSILRIKPDGRKTGEKFKDHTSFGTEPYKLEVQAYAQLAAEVIAECDRQGLSTIVVNCYSGKLRSSILCCAIYRQLTDSDVKAAMTAMKESRAQHGTTLAKDTKHCVGAALGRQYKKAL